MPRLGRRIWGTIAVAAGSAGAALWLLWSQPARLLDLIASRYPGCLYRVRTEARLVALTIDDGPDPASTARILAALERGRAHATFFMTSSRIPGQEEVVRRVVQAGHELGNHLTRDEPSIDLSPREFEAALLAAHRALAKLGAPVWMRPASGWYSDTMIAIARRRGYRCALGSVYPYDAAIPSAGFTARLILRNVGPGDIVILHDGGRRGVRTAQVLRRVLPELRRRGFRVVTLSELVRAA